MIVDSSAIIAIVTEEPNSEVYLEALLASRTRRISAATLLEAAIVVDRHPSPLAAPRFDRLIERFRFVIEPVTASQVMTARRTYQSYGKRSGHLAKLNFGDCFAYALAKETNEPLLFVGQDFVHTDVWPAVPVSIQPWPSAPVGGTVKSTVRERPGAMTAKMDLFEAERVDHCTPEMRRWYLNLRAFMLGLGQGESVNVYARGVKSGHVGFWRSRPTAKDRIFAYANFRPTLNQIVIDIGYPSTPLHLDGEFLAPWTGKQKRDKVVHIVVDSDEDVERAKPYIRQRYRSLD